MFDKDKSEASLPKSKQVGKYTVYKLALIEYAELFEKMEKLPDLLGGLPDQSEDTIIKNLPSLISRALPEVIAMLAVVCREDAETLGQELDLHEAIDVVEAAIEVNRFLEAWGKMKGLAPKITQS